MSHSIDQTNNSRWLEAATFDYSNPGFICEDSSILNPIQSVTTIYKEATSNDNSGASRNHHQEQVSYQSLPHPQPYNSSILVSDYRSSQQTQQASAPRGIHKECLSARRPRW